MTVTILECSKCHGRFNYEFSWGASPSSIKRGNRAIFKCPICRELNDFDLESKGRDPTLPTFNDLQVGIGGRLWGLLLGPFLVLAAIGVVLSITLAGSPSFLLFPVPIVGGIVWVLATVYFMKRRVSTRQSNSVSPHSNISA